MGLALISGFRGDLSKRGEYNNSGGVGGGGGGGGESLGSLTSLSWIY